MNFNCYDNKEKWSGKIERIENRTNYYEIKIVSRSSIFILLGKTSRGNFACFPDFNVGCHLVDLKDKFWNKEKLIEVLGRADGISVASALEYLSAKNLLLK
ncbi:MAG: hypothetical protein JW924_14250 [Fusobacteriaceae bacterium]|nr:hypothetical protein [Fusobacteriaceae bacterium]